MKYLLMLFAVCMIATRSDSQQLIKDSDAPELVFKDSSGIQHSLSDLKGKIVLVDFWASWCMPCREAMPLIKQAYKKYRSMGFEIIGVSFDAGVKEWKKAIAKDGSNWWQVMDDDGSIAHNWDVNYLPMSYLINEDGKIAAIEPLPNQLDLLIQKLLKK